MSGSKGPPMDMAGWQSEYAPTSPPPDMGLLSTGTGQSFREAREEHLATLAQAIEQEIIPRLVDARRAGTQTNPGASCWQPDAGEIDQFVRLLLDRDETLAVAQLRCFLDSGIRLETIYATLLTQAARLLGTMWEEDDVNFTAVTTAVWRMQQILHGMSNAFIGTVAPRADARRILLVPAIGEQHSFGLSMVSEYFRRAGWEVSCEMASSNDELAALVRGSWFDVIGFSVGDGNHLAGLATTIRTTRRASRNLRLGVMVGGPVFVADAGLAGDVGADATAADAAQAVRAAERLATTLAAHA